MLTFNIGLGEHKLANLGQQLLTDSKRALKLYVTKVKEEKKVTNTFISIRIQDGLILVGVTSM